MLFTVLVQALATLLQHPNAAAVQMNPYSRTHSVVGITTCAMEPTPSLSTQCVSRPSPRASLCASASLSPAAWSCKRPLSPRLLRHGSRTPRRCVPRSAHPQMHAPLVREAEAGFVDGSNLEEGESLLRALKAFDLRGRCLCAGALVRTPHDAAEWTTGADHDQGTCGSAQSTARKGVEAATAASESRGAVHLWLADADVPELGPNMQLRGALCVLDALLLEHLTRFGTHDALFVHASGELAVASAAAAAARGFEQTEEDGSWTFDTVKGSEAYSLAAAVRNGDADDEGRERAAAILAMLTRQLGTLQFSRKSMGQVELCDAERYGEFVARGFDRGAAPSLLVGVLGAEAVSEARRLSAQAGAEGACEAAGGARRVVLVRAGQEVERASSASLQRLQRIVRPGVSRVLEYVRRHVVARQPAASGGLPCAKHVLVLTDCFVQHFGTSGDDAGGHDANGDHIGLPERDHKDVDTDCCDDIWQSVVTPHNAEYTALVQLTSIDGQGGGDDGGSEAGADVYLQLGVHASARLRVPLAVTGSAFVHDYAVQSVVRLRQAGRELGRQTEQGQARALRRTPSRESTRQQWREFGHQAGQERGQGSEEELGSRGREAALSAYGALLVLHFASVSSLAAVKINGSSPASWLWDRARRGDATAQHRLARSLEQGAR